MPKAQNRAGKGSIILWRRFTFPIFLLFIYGWELIVERYILIPEQLNYVEIYVVHCTVYTVYSLQKVTINRFVACRWYPNKLSCCCSDAKKCRVPTLPTVPSPHRAGALGFFSSSNIKLDTMRLPLLFFLAVNLLIFHNHATSSFACRRHLSPPLLLLLRTKPNMSTKFGGAAVGGEIILWNLQFRLLLHIYVTTNEIHYKPTTVLLDTRSSTSVISEIFGQKRHMFPEAVLLVCMSRKLDWQFLRFWPAPGFLFTDSGSFSPLRLQLL